MINIMNDHGLEQPVHFPTKEKKKKKNISGTLRVIIPPIKKPRRKVYLYLKGDFESLRKDAFEFAKRKIFQWPFGYSDTRKLRPDYILYRILRINTFHQKLVALSPRSHG